MSWSLNDVPNSSFNAALDDWITREPDSIFNSDDDDYYEEDEEWED